MFINIENNVILKGSVENKIGLRFFLLIFIAEAKKKS
jgi:hypothetical protein